MNGEMESRLDALLDREAIRDLLHRMARAMDRMDNETLLACYWPGAIDDHSHFVGSPEGFVGYVNKMTLSFQSCQHGLLTHNCELSGDEAFAETYYIFTGELAQPPHFMSTGRYVDHLQKRGGEWRILNRVTIVDGAYDMAEAAITAAMPSPYPPGEKPVSRDRNDISYQRPLRTRKPPA